MFFFVCWTKKVILKNVNIPLIYFDLIFPVFFSDARIRNWIRNSIDLTNKPSQKPKLAWFMIYLHFGY